MKSLFALMLLLVPLACAQAQDPCSLKNRTLVAFANGILTSQKDATRSLSRLMAELAVRSESEKMRYKLTYNYTDGPIVDLLQSFNQVGIQFSSQIMAWLNKRYLAPDWLDDLMQTIFNKASTINAHELTDHVKMYEMAIGSDEQVLVVAHSQGNLYANEARKLLQLTLNEQDIRSFVIYGVATPSNNIGGLSEPYLTNYRDIILLVPGALPSNLQLRHANGKQADDLSRVMAHSFIDTYISPEFDARPVLLAGINHQLDRLADNSRLAPPKACLNYRKAFIGLFAGTFSCEASLPDHSGRLASVGANGVMTLGGESMDVSTSTTSLVIDRVLVDPAGISTGMVLFGRDEQQHRSTLSYWSATGELEMFSIASTCSKSKEIPSMIPAPVDLGRKASDIMQGYRGSLPSCSIVDENGQTQQKPLKFSIDGTTLSIGDQRQDLIADRALESVTIPSADLMTPPDQTPQFYFLAKYVDGTEVALRYTMNSGITMALMSTKTKVVTCSTEQWPGDIGVSAGLGVGTMSRAAGRPRFLGQAQ